jgi:predicted nucleotidyltransferase
MPTSIEMLQTVAHALGPLKDKVVFVGGTIPSLLITDPAAPSLRPTKDVDLIVDTQKRQQYADFEAKLRGLGFQIQSPPICRYGIDDILVDVMTTSNIQGFSDRWYPEAFSTAEETTLPNGTLIRTIRAPLFLATKLNAWRERGMRDYLAHDIEDILAVIDGRVALLDEIRQSSLDVQQFLAGAFKELMDDERFREIIPAHLGGDSIVYQRVELAVRIIEQIIGLNN